MKDTRRYPFTTFGKTLTCIGVLGWFSSFGYFAYLEKTRPTGVALGSSQTVMEQDHANVFFVTPTEEVVIQFSRWGSFVIGAVGIALSISKREFTLH
jgi:hypothetical protein